MPESGTNRAENKGYQLWLMFLFGPCMALGVAIAVSGHNIIRGRAFMADDLWYRSLGAAIGVIIFGCAATLLTPEGKNRYRAQIVALMLGLGLGRPVMGLVIQDLVRLLF